MALRRLPCGPALTRSVVVGLTELYDVTREVYVALYTAAGHAPLTFNQSAFVRYHGYMDRGEQTQVDVCLPFDADAAWPEDLPAGLAVVDIPDEPFASTRLRGDAATFPAVMDGYRAVSDWMAQHGFAYAGPAYEIYRRWRGRVGHPDNELEVGYPVA